MAFLLPLASLCAAASGDPLPIGQALSPDEIARVTELRELGSVQQPAERFRMLVPRAWKVVELPPEEKVEGERLRTVARIEEPDPPGPAAIFHVQTLPVDREIRAAHLARLHHVGLKQELVHARELSPLFIDTLVRQQIEGEPFMLRIAFLLNGSRLFVLTGVAHASAYPELATLFGLMIASFEPLKPAGRPGVEDWVTTALGESLSFTHPASWTSQQVAARPEHVLAADLGSAGLPARIRIELETGFAPDSDEQEFDRMRTTLSAGDVGFSDQAPVDVMLDGPEGQVRLRAMRRHDVRLAGTEQGQELRMVLGDYDGGALRIWALMPDRDQDFLSWALTDRAFRIVLSTLEAID